MSKLGAMIIDGCGYCSRQGGRKDDVGKNKTTVQMGGKNFELTYATGENVKVGDKVIVQGRYNTCIEEVVKVTPTKCFRTSGDGYFNRDGFDKRGDVFWTDIVFLYDEEFAQQLSNEEFRHRVLYGLNNLKEITFEQACEVNKILGLVGKK